jgi:hypothetical protein
VPDADLSTELLLKYALTRRGLAYDQASLISFVRHDAWVERMFTLRLRAPLTGYARVSLEQLERADKEVWRRLAEVTRDGIVPDGAGVRPLDAALDLVCLEPEIAQLLTSMLAASSSKRVAEASTPPHSEATVSKRQKKKQRQTLAHAALASSGSISKAPPGGAPGKGKGKGAGKGSLPAGLQGTSKTPDGANICYGFQFGTCTGPAVGCPKGKHVCTKCYANHPFSQGGH